MGDLFFWSVVRDLIEAPRPPVAVSAATRRVAWHRRVLRLTPTGRALLGGKLDWQAAAAAGALGRRHSGGPGAPNWRWNPRSRRATRLE